LKDMRDKGALTIAQDEKSSVVWGMPGAAVALGAVDRILPIEQIAQGLVGPSGDRDEGEERLAAGS
jgi:two-component system chemotaxis response regulator CheB